MMAVVWGLVFDVVDVLGNDKSIKHFTNINKNKVLITNYKKNGILKVFDDKNVDDYDNLSRDNNNIRGFTSDVTIGHFIIIHLMISRVLRNESSVMSFFVISFGE